MAKKEDRYNVTLKMNLSIDQVDDKGNVLRNWHGGNYDLDYPGMDYVQIVATQQAMSHFGQILCNLGWGDAAVIGYDMNELALAKRIAQGEDPASLVSSGGGSGGKK